jgi:hypothetical protein
MEMTTSSIAPCGLICDLCSGFQRERNKCDGCNGKGNKPTYCSKCSIKLCPERSKDTELCYKCENYPCKKLKNLEKRYKIKYGESLFCNFEMIKEIGIRAFIKQQNDEWKCPTCGKILCVHKVKCNYCGSQNRKHPKN